MGSIFTFLAGWKTYIAALGFVGKAIYDASIKDYASAVTDLMAALAAAGLRGAIASEAKQQTDQIKVITQDQTKAIEAKVVSTARQAL